MPPGRVSLTKAELLKKAKSYYHNGYPTPKWVQFSLCMLAHGLSVDVYEAKKTVSKYIYVRNPENGLEVKVRFSNHRPNAYKESAGDADFYVGVYNYVIQTTEQVIPQVLEALGRGGEQGEELGERNCQ